MLTRHEREQLYLKIVDEAVEVSIGVRSAQEIDRVNVLEADKEAMTDAVKALRHRPSHLIIDAVNLNYPHGFAVLAIKQPAAPNNFD